MLFVKLVFLKTALGSGFRDVQYLIPWLFLPYTTPLNLAVIAWGLWIGLSEKTSSELRIALLLLGVFDLLALVTVLFL